MPSHPHPLPWFLRRNRPQQQQTSLSRPSNKQLFQPSRTGTGKTWRRTTKHAVAALRMFRAPAKFIPRFSSRAAPADVLRVGRTPKLSVALVRKMISDQTQWRLVARENFFSRQSVGSGVQTFIVASAVASTDALLRVIQPTIRDKLTIMGVGVGPRSLPRFALLSTHHVFKMRGAGPTGGLVVSCYKVTPRQDRPMYSTSIAGQPAALYHLPEEMQDVTNTQSNPNSTSITQIGWSPYDMPLLTARYKIKTLFRGVLLPGEQKTVFINQYFRGGAGVVVNPMVASSVHTAGVVPETQVYMHKPYKPYYMLVQMHGSIGGEAATNPSNVGHVAGMITLEEEINYNVTYSPIQSETMWTSSSEQSASFSTQVPVSTANAATTWP